EGTAEQSVASRNEFEKCRLTLHPVLLGRRGAFDDYWPIERLRPQYAALQDALGIAPT
nr:hypothetical protein [Tanacetum cinerariifolium]